MDDEPALVRVVADSPGREGFDVATASAGTRARRIARERPLASSSGTS